MVKLKTISIKITFEIFQTPLYLKNVYQDSSENEKTLKYRTKRVNPPLISSIGILFFKEF